MVQSYFGPRSECVCVCMLACRYTQIEHHRSREREGMAKGGGYVGR